MNVSTQRSCRRSDSSLQAINNFLFDHCILVNLLLWGKWVCPQSRPHLSYSRKGHNGWEGGVYWAGGDPGVVNICSIINHSHFAFTPLCQSSLQAVGQARSQWLSHASGPNPQSTDGKTEASMGKDWVPKMHHSGTDWEWQWELVC